PLTANGIVATLAIMRGERPFVDRNGNGVCDDDIDTLAAVPEPFYDSNCNGMYDPGENFVDLNNNTTFDLDQGTGNCSDAVILSPRFCPPFAGHPRVRLPRPGPAPLPAGGSADFPLVVSDDLNTPIVGGSTVSITAVGARARIVGPTTLTIPDAITFNKL